MCNVLHINKSFLFSFDISFTAKSNKILTCVNKLIVFGEGLSQWPHAPPIHAALPIHAYCVTVLRIINFCIIIIMLVVITS